MIDAIDKCLNNSFAKISTICPQNNVLSGLSVRDKYHERNYSMLTLCQMLWAITSSGIVSKTYYLTAELLSQVNNEIDTGKYYENNDRVYTDAFILLSLTCSGQPINSQSYINAINIILSKQNTTGWWGTYSGGQADIRATAFSLLAIAECYRCTCPSSIEPYNKLEDAMISSAKWLIKQYTENYYCERMIKSFSNEESKKTYGTELTAFVSLALLKCNIYLSANNLLIDNLKPTIINSVRWFMSLEPTSIAQISEIEEEIYIESKKQYTHDYGTGSLDIIILFLSEFLTSDCYIYIDNLEKRLYTLLEMLIKNERNGEWYDKNSDSYNRVWTISYAVVSLTSCKEYYRQKSSFKKLLKKNIFNKLYALKAVIFKYALNPYLDVVYLLIGFLAFWFHEFINNRIEFINSTAISSIGIVLGLIGLIFPRIEKAYERRRK